MRNSDMSNVNQIARTLGLKQEITTANNINSEKEYPYIFIDRTNKARSRKTEVFVDILSPALVLVRGSMKFHLLSQTDFDRFFKIRDTEFADYQKPETKSIESCTHKTGTKRPNWDERKWFDNRIRNAIKKFAKH